MSNTCVYFTIVKYYQLHKQEVWTYSVVTQSLEIKEGEGEDEQVTLLGRVSPIAWQYINFHGRFEFLDPPAPIDLESVVQDLVRGAFSISEDLD